MCQFALYPHPVPDRCPALAVVDLELVAVKASFHGIGFPAVDALIPVVLAVALGFIFLARIAKLLGYGGVVCASMTATKHVGDLGYRYTG